MRGAWWTTCLYPGLPQLWWRGAWSGLALAIGFSLLLNGALAVSWTWPELVSPTVRNAAWVAVGASWLASCWAGSRWLWRTGAAAQANAEAGFYEQARDAYLRGHWLDAEGTLHDLLTRDPSDVDGRLLLASLYRRTRRRDEAQRALARLERVDGAEKWHDEIRRERQLLADAAARELHEKDDTDNLAGAMPPRIQEAA